MTETTKKAPCGADLAENTGMRYWACSVHGPGCTSVPSSAIELQAHYDRNADATGHAAGCRRRVPPQIGSDHLAFDPERCERCGFLVAPR